MTLTERSREIMRSIEAGELNIQSVHSIIRELTDEHERMVEDRKLDKRIVKKYWKLRDLFCKIMEIDQ